MIREEEKSEQIGEGEERRGREAKRRRKKNQGEGTQATVTTGYHHFSRRPVSLTRRAIVNRRSCEGKDFEFQQTIALVNATKGKDYSPPVSFPYLPDDILLNCLARISRLYYPNLSLVSKRFRSLVASTELYETRRLLGSTERCPYFCFSSPDSSQPCWFALITGQTPIPKCNARGFPSGYSPCWNRTTTDLMVSVPSQNFCPPDRWVTTTIGFNIYMIGGYINSRPSSRVFVLDCRSHTWHEAPSMRVARKSPLATAVDGKIYVVESRSRCDLSDFIECFNPKTQIWEHVPSPGAEMCRESIIESYAHEGSLYLAGRKSMVYKPKENKWYEVESRIHCGGRPKYNCIVDEDEVSYIYAMGSRSEFRYRSRLGSRPSTRLLWYSKELSFSRPLKGLQQLPAASYDNSVSLENYGGNIAVLWEKDVRGFGWYEKKEFWCAEIAIKRPNKEEVYGQVEEWRDAVLTVPKSSSLKRFIVATF